MIASRMTNPTAPDPGQLVENVLSTAFGYVNSQVLFSADDHGVFDFLEPGPRDLQSIATHAGIGVGPAERMLIVLCALGLLKRDGAAFELTDASRTCLLKSQPTYVGGMFPFMKNALYPLFAHFDSALADPKPQWEKIPGMSPEGPFEALYKDEPSLRDFQRTMFALSYPTAMAACEHFDFSKFESIVDVGGGTGGFVNAVCDRFPNVGGTIFDLPPVEKAAMDTARERENEGRIRFIRGNFFTDPLPTDADLFVLGDILHDWSEEDGTKLLKKVYEALPEHGALCVLENLFHESKDGPYVSSIINTTMLVAAFGEQRAPSELERWLSGIGFERFEHRFLPTPRDVFVAWKRK